MRNALVWLIIVLSLVFVLWFSWRRSTVTEVGPVAPAVVETEVDRSVSPPEAREPLDSVVERVPVASSDTSAQTDSSVPPGDETKGVIRGKVVGGTDGEPVADARVWIRPEETGREVRTGSDGRFRFSGLEDGRHLLQAEADEWISDLRLVTLEDGEPLEVELVLEPTCLLTVTVVDEEEIPVADVAVMALGSGIAEGAVSDQRGKLRLRLTQKAWRLAIRDGDRVRRPVPVDLSGVDTHAITMTLTDPEGGTLSGLVTDRNGLPIGRVDLRIRYANYEKSVVVTTTERGGWYVPDLPLHETFVIEVGRDAFRKQVRDIRFGHGKHERRVDIALDVTAEEARSSDGLPRVSLTLDVVDRSDHPVVDAEVSSQEETNRILGQTDSFGRVVLPDLEVPRDYRYTLFVSAEGMVTVRQIISPDPAEQTIRVVMERGVTVSGRVIDEQGNPLTDVTVSADIQYTATDENGAFTVGPVSASGSLSFHKIGYRDQKLPLSGQAIDVPITVTMARAKQLRGRVIDAETGEPVTSYVLMTETEVRSRGGASSRRSNRTINREDGVFHLQNLDNQSFRLIIRAKGYSAATFDPVSPGSDDTIVDFPLKAGQLRVAGVVTDEGGQPVPGVPLQLWLSAGSRPGLQNLSFQTHDILEQHTSVSDETGAFSFEGITSELDATLVAYSPGLSPILEHEVTRQDDRESLHLMVVPGSTVLLELDREQYPDFNSVQLMGSERHYFSVPLAQAEEEFLIDGLYAGRWQVTLFREDRNQSISGPGTLITLESGETQTVRFGFDQTFTLSGTVLLEDGRVPTGQRLVLADSSYQKEGITLGRDGMFRFEKLPAGRYRLVLMNDPGHNERIHYIPYDHPNQQEVVIEDRDVIGTFTFKALGNIVGRVVSEDAGLQIALSRDGLQRKAYPVGPLGRFTIPEPGPGEYSLLLLGFLEGSSLHLTDVILPDDGQDLDVGELVPEGFANLHVIRKGPLGVGPVYLRVLAPPNNIYVDSNASDGYLLPPEERTLRVPSGPSSFAIAPGIYGYRAVPPVFEIDLKPGETGEVSIALLPVTRLVVGNSANQRPTRVAVTAPDGTRYVAEVTSGQQTYSYQRPVPDGNPQTWMGMIAAFFESLPAGTYQISAEWPDASFEREVTLTPGEPVLVTW